MHMETAGTGAPKQAHWYPIAKLTQAKQRVVFGGQPDPLAQELGDSLAAVAAAGLRPVG